MDASDIADVLADAYIEPKDLTSLNREELIAEIVAIDRRTKLLRRAQLRLLESMPEVVATRPDLQEELDFLRTLELDVVSGPGS